MMLDVALTMNEIDVIFPFNFVIDDNSSIVHAGPTLTRLLPDIIGVRLDEIFDIGVPEIPPNYEDICSHCAHLFKLQAHQLDKLVLKGQMLHLLREKQLLFVGSPWFTTNEDIYSLNLKLDDFAIHDSVPDFILHTYSLQKSLNDAQELAARFRSLNQQLESHVVERTQDVVAANESLVDVNEDLRHEIAERKQAEEALQNSEALYRNLVETTAAAAWEIDIATKKFTYISPQIFDITGFTPEQWTDYNFWVAHIHPDDRECAVHYCEIEVAKGLDHTFDYRMITADGRIIWLRDMVSTILEEGQVKALRGYFIDITERMRAEAVLHQYAQIVSSSTDMLALLNNKYIYSAANTAYLQRYKLTSEQLIGHSVSEVFGEEFFKTVIKPNADRCLAGEEVNNQAWFNFPEFGERYMDITYYPYTDDENRIQGFVVNGRDITKQHEMEKELFNARKLESVGVLAGGIAHDFNNILTGLFGNIELAKLKLPQDHAAYTYIETANQALEEATHLTKQLLTFAKGGDPILEAVNVAQVIESSLEFNLSGGNVKTVLNLPDKLWQAKADKGQLSQVIANLTLNAKQAMPEGGTLYIDVENIQDIKENTVPHLSGDFVKINMRDEGAGISDKHLGKIFDPYFTTKQTGSGLGLTTVYSIIAKHNGHISIDSKLGIGTTFTLYFPADKSSHKTTDTSPLSVSEQSASTSKYILVMDDEEMVRELSIQMLEVCGYTGSCAADGKDTLEKYISANKSGNPFDIVIMDLTIPGGIGGKETVKKLLAIDPEARVIVSSGYSTDPVMANYSDYGFKGRLVKPFRVTDLRKELSRVMALG